jgi:hypothetical protein
MERYREMRDGVVELPPSKQSVPLRCGMMREAAGPR